MVTRFTRDGDGKPDGQGIIPITRISGNDIFFTEQFKALRAKIEYKIDMLRYRAIAVTSAVAGEGKTLASVHLGMQLASVGRKRVLLIDADLRKSDVAGALNVRPLPGLTEYLFGSVEVRDIVRRSTVPGLHVIPAGTRFDNPAELLAGDAFRTFLGKLRDGEPSDGIPPFDLVLLDTPPVLPVADTLSLKDQIDALIFIFRLGFTPYKLLHQAIEEIGDRSIIGVILNGVEPESQKYYHRYYGKYYRKVAESAKDGTKETPPARS